MKLIVCFLVLCVFRSIHSSPVSKDSLVFESELDLIDVKSRVTRDAEEDSASPPPSDETSESDTNEPGDNSNTSDPSSSDDMASTVEPDMKSSTMMPDKEKVEKKGKNFISKVGSDIKSAAHDVKETVRKGVNRAATYVKNKTDDPEPEEKNCDSDDCSMVDEAKSKGKEMMDKAKERSRRSPRNENTSSESDDKSSSEENQTHLLNKAKDMAKNPQGSASPIMSESSTNSPPNPGNDNNAN